MEIVIRQQNVGMHNLKPSVFILVHHRRGTAETSLMRKREPHQQSDKAQKRFCPESRELTNNGSSWT
jgi:hypothetical protein